MTLRKTFTLRADTNAQSLYAFLRHNWRPMAESGKPLDVTVAEHKSKRSTDQNRRLHALLRDIAEQAWVAGRQYDAEIWKEEARRKFIGTEEIILPSGFRIERGISTTTLDVSEFTEFMERIEAWATMELGVRFSE